MKWHEKAKACDLLIREYTNTNIMHTNRRAMVIAKDLKTNSLECLSPLVNKAFEPKVVITKKTVGIQKWEVFKY